MARTQVTGREVSDRSLFYADIDLSTAPVHPSLVATDRFLIVDPTDGIIKTSTLANLVSSLDTRYSLLAHTHSYEPVIAPGTTAQYWRGDKTWQTMPVIPTITAADKQILFMNGSNIIGYPGLTFNQYTGDFKAGIYAAAVGGNSCAIGTNASAIYDGCIALGYGAEAAGNQSICIGTYSNAYSGQSISIGIEATADGDNCIAIGRGATASANNDISIGSLAYNNNTSLFGAIRFPSISGTGFLKISSGAVSVDTGNYASSGHNHPFSELLEVDFLAPGNGDLIHFNGTEWTNFTPMAQLWELNTGVISPVNTTHHLSILENNFWAGNGLFTKELGATVALYGYRLNGGNQDYLQSEEYLGKVDFFANNGGNGNFTRTAAIEAIAEYTHDSKALPTKLRFLTTETDRPAEAMAINRFGFVSVNVNLTVNTNHLGGDALKVYGSGAGAAFTVTDGKVNVNQSTGFSNLNVGGSLSLKSRYINSTPATLADEFMVYLVLGASALKCPYGNAAVDRMYFVANGSTSAITLSVQTGEYLNGTLNGTFSVKATGLTIVHQGEAADVILGGTRWYAYELR